MIATCKTCGGMFETTTEDAYAPGGTDCPRCHGVNAALEFTRPKRPSNSIDLNDPCANMFGLLPCPRCFDTHRWPTQPIHPTDPNAILCDACGHKEPRGEDVTS